jgi:AraC-like DNA-binding protein
MPEVRQFLADFREATGLEIRFLDTLGRCGGDEAATFSCALCQRLHATVAGARLCQRFTQQLLEEVEPAGTTRRCDAGLHETAVPLRLGGQDLGYFVFGPMAAPGGGPAALNRARHLLRRAGVPLEVVELARLTAEAPQAGPARQEAMRRIVAAWVEHLSGVLARELAQPPTELPPAIARVCRAVRERFSTELRVPELAREVGLSTGHLSRLFHHYTGLRLVDYIARVRVEKAREAIVQTQQPITEVALACGFGSLSQFNRAFRRIVGQAPRQLRVPERPEARTGADRRSAPRAGGGGTRVAGFRGRRVRQGAA